MTAAFADTSYFVALLSPSDVHHARARELSGTRRGYPIVTSDWILTELSTFCLPPTGRAAFVGLLDLLRADPNTTILPADRLWFNRGLTLFERRLDKPWSLTDCISFEIMRHRRIAEALTADHHFEQAGLTAVLK